jgi:hypothetical protein
MQAFLQKESRGQEKKNKKTSLLNNEYENKLIKQY